MEQFEESFRFHPTDAEGLTFLLRFIAGQVMHDGGFITTDVDVYDKEEPWEIYNRGVPCGNDDDLNCSQYRFFITKLKKMSKSKHHRNVGNNGSWKQQDKGKPVKYSSSVAIGSKKSMTYTNKKGYNQKDGNWLMKEYKLSRAILQKFHEDCRDYVLCAIKKRLAAIKTPPEETSNLCLEYSTTFLNFQESHDEGMESTSNSCKNLEQSTTFLNFQESDNNIVEQSNSAQKTTFNLDVLEEQQLNKKDIGGMLHEDMCIVEPLLGVEPFYTSMFNYVPEDMLSVGSWDLMYLDELNKILND